MVYAAPVAMLFAFWLPGCNDGWFVTDSHYYAAVGLEAVRSGHWLDLRLGDVPYHNKPPLALLIHGWFLSVLGVHVWVGRLPSLLAAAGAVCGMIKLVSIVPGGGRRLGLGTGLTLVLTVEFVRYDRAISLDLWLACFTAWGLAALAWACRDERPRRLLLLGLAVGAGLMVKPFIAAFALPMAAVWLAATGRTGPAWRIAWLGAAGVAVAVAAPWMIAMAVYFPGTFLHTYVVEQSVERLGWETDRRWWYYGRIALETYVPWIAALVYGAFVLLRPSSPRGPLAPPPGTRRLLIACWVWALVWLVMISLAGDKHGRYAVPAYLLLAVPAAWGASVALPRAAKAFRRAALTWLAPGVVALSVVLFAGLTLAHARVAAPPPPVWSELATRLAPEYDAPPPSAGDARSVLRTTPAANKLAANMVLVGRPWPRLATAERPALAGQVLLMSTREAAGPAGSLGERVAEGPEVVAIRIEPGKRWPN